MGINLSNFLASKSQDRKMNQYQDLDHIDGLSISTVCANLYKTKRDDLVMFYFREGANFAAIYTTSKVTSASINWNLRLRKHHIRALLVNTKNANTFTGTKGALGLKEIANSLSKTLTIKSSQSPEGASDVVKITDLLFASTGVIGEEFPYLKIKDRIPELVKKLKVEQNKVNNMIFKIQEELEENV